jgi:hypothetical protein
VGESSTAATPSASIRWAGVALVVASVALIAMFLMYVVAYGAPVATGADGAVTTGDRAAHVLANWSLVSWIWLVETFVWVTLAVAGFTLQRRARPGSCWLPASVAWVFVGVGSVIQSLMYAFMIGGYPASAAVAADIPALVDSFRGAATFLFGLGNAVFFGGLAGVLLAEAGPGGVIPRRQALVAGAICAFQSVLFVGILVGLLGMMAAGPGGLLAMLALAWLGAAIWRRG